VAGAPSAAVDRAVVEALEICAGSAFALEVALGKVAAEPGEHRDARDAIRSAIELVRSALTGIQKQAPAGTSGELALGFVTRQALAATPRDRPKPSSAAPD